ncbi:uncharacterized protein LOC131622114 [Vicia villosa]|uniref:uncharacterized protein LOC131622114 n=1 Tax=Vicia villosa TaxID=3911 RepID=UPI00273CB61A|nr:uncharacterized protein LOC131622114 [Vicia villosa]
MAGRNDAAIAAALEAVAQALEHLSNVGENAASRNLATFQRENPPVFKGTHDPDGALTWLKEIERIFRVMDCTPDQKVRYGTHILAVKAEDWWLETRQRLEANGEEITWVVFTMEFLRKYFPEDVSGKKEIEFLELRQGNRLVVEYATKLIMMDQLVNFQSASSLRMDCAQKLRRQLVIRRFVSLPIWLIVVRSMRRTTMLIIGLLVSVTRWEN